MTLVSSATFPAFGSTAVVAVADPAALDPAVDAVTATVEQVDLACSRFREDSELVELNHAAGCEVEVSPLLLRAVLAALRAAELTDGDVDPTVGRALIALGYDRDYAQLSDQAAATRPMSIARVPGWQTIRVDRDRSTVRAPRGVSLDLGATAKALGADLAAGAALAAAGCGVLVGFGGDFAAAGPAPERGWRIRVTDDHRAGVAAPGQWITITGGGLATSSTTVRRWRAGDATPHHLVDPATGAPADVVWRTVSVTAASCLDANIASTASVIRGERAVPWLEQLGLPSRLVSAGGAVLHVAGWPPSGDDLMRAEPAGVSA